MNQSKPIIRKPSIDNIRSNSSLKNNKIEACLSEPPTFENKPKQKHSIARETVTIRSGGLSQLTAAINQNLNDHLERKPVIARESPLNRTPSKSKLPVLKRGSTYIIESKTNKSESPVENSNTNLAQMPNRKLSVLRPPKSDEIKISGMTKNNINSNSRSVETIIENARKSGQLNLSDQTLIEGFLFILLAKFLF